MVSDGSTFLPSLRISEDKAKQEIEFQIEKGHEIRNMYIWNSMSLKKAQTEMFNWSEQNVLLLNTIFDDESMVRMYDRAVPEVHFTAIPLDQGTQELQSAIDLRISTLNAILGRIQHRGALEQEEESSIGYERCKMGVFIVHGRDSDAKYQLKDLLRDWGIEPIILHEQPNQGRVIIEKFEYHSDMVGCAIILLTPDDEARVIGTEDLRPRARQNVIFELGYFSAKLGRDKTICLCKSDVELPSDISGIIYISFGKDLKREVYSDLRNELKEIGFDIRD